MKFGLREIVFIALLLLIPVGTWWFVLRPSNIRNTEMLGQIKAKQAKLAELNHATGTIGDLKAQIAGLEKAISYFQSKLPDEKEMDKVLKEVWLLAEANHLSTKSIRTLQKQAEGGFTTADGPQAEQPIAMQLEGDFIGFYSFLQALENQPRIMRVSKMTVQKMDKGPQGAVEAKFEMSIFFDRGNQAKKKDAADQKGSQWNRKTST
jgi:type IV pilus assembly protein PilO